MYVIVALSFLCTSGASPSASRVSSIYHRGLHARARYPAASLGLFSWDMIHVLCQQGISTSFFLTKNARPIRSSTASKATQSFWRRFQRVACPSIVRREHLSQREYKEMHSLEHRQVRTDRSSLFLQLFKQRYHKSTTFH